MKMSVKERRNLGKFLAILEEMRVRLLESMTNEGWEYVGLQRSTVEKGVPGCRVLLGGASEKPPLVWGIQRRPAPAPVVNQLRSAPWEEWRGFKTWEMGAYCMGSGHTSLWVEVVKLIQK